MNTYEKKYKEALAKAREIKSKILSSHLSTESCKAVSEYIDEIIPELRESEDERIRKWLIELVESQEPNVFVEVKKMDVFAWLEKQKERVPENAETGTQEQKSAENGIDVIKTSALLAADRLASAEMTGRLKERSEILDNPTKYGLQKPVEWSEEDNRMIGRVRGIIERYAFTQNAVDVNGELCEKEYVEMDAWLKSLRPIVNANSEKVNVNWSEEDEEMRKLIIAVLQVNHPNGFFKANDLGDSNMRGVPVEELVAWLKSLRPTKD